MAIRIFRSSLIVTLLVAIASISLAQPHPHFTVPKDEPVPHTATLPTVQKVVLSIQNANGDTLPDIIAIPGEIVELPGCGLSIRVSDFYCHWMIKKTPVNYSTEEKNPAIKVTVLKGDSILYDKWAFQNLAYYGRNAAIGHASEGSDQLYFTLVKYEGMAWPNK